MTHDEYYKLCEAVNVAKENLIQALNARIDGIVSEIFAFATKPAETAESFHEGTAQILSSWNCGIVSVMKADRKTLESLV